MMKSQVMHIDKRVCMFAKVLMTIALTVAVFFLSLECFSHSKPHVIATLPAIQSILRDLTAKTDIVVQNAIPADISIAELDQFIGEHQSFLDSLSRCDAVFDLRSIIRQDAFYPQLRKRNIRIVEVDCAQPCDPAISPIPVLRNGNDINPFVWLSVSNAIKMAEIMAKDLVILYPAYRDGINGNLTDFKQRFFALKATSESSLARVADFQAAAMTDEFDYFLSDVNLFVPYRYGPDDNAWGFGEKKDFFEKVQNGRIRTLVHRWKPQGVSAGMCDSAHVKVAVLVLGDPAMKSFENGLYGLIKNNYATLQEAFRR